MISNYSLVGLIIDALKNNGWKQMRFASEVETSPSFISRVLSGEKTIPLSVLDKAIKCLQLDKHECYKLYFDELWCAKKRSSRLIEEYLIHCLDADLDEHSDRAMELLLEEGGYLSSVYAAGEKLFQRGDQRESLRFFEAVVTHEMDRTSSFLAMSHFRQLMYYIHKDKDKTEEFAFRLCELLEYIPDKEILEAHYYVIGAFRLTEKWPHVLQFGEKLVKLANVMKRPDYVGDALIKMAVAAREKEDYELAIKYHGMCERITVGNYSRWAKGNRLITIITAGDNDKAFELLTFCRENRDISDEYLEFLLETAVQNDYDEIIQAILDEFTEQVHYLESQKENRSIYARRLICFSFAKAIYQVKNNDIKGIEEALRVAELAVSLRFRKQALQSLKFILTHADKASTAYQKGLLLLDQIA